MKSRVKELYTIVKTVDMREDVEGWEDEIYEYTLNSEDEKKVLVGLFNTEKDSWDKWELADILARLKYKKVIPFLLHTIYCSQEESHKLLALYTLVRLELPAAYELVRGAEKYRGDIPLWDIMNEIADLPDEGNQMAKEIRDEYFETHCLVP